MITVKYGMRSATTEATTLADVQADENLKAFLAYGESVTYTRNGVELNSLSTLSEGDVVVIAQRANSKA